MSAAPLLVLHAWIGTAVTVLALWFLLKVVNRRLGSTATLGVLLVSTGSNFVTQSTNVMEWHWVVLFAALTVYAIVEGRAWLCFGAALAGAWARSDSPFLVVAAVGAAAFVAYRTHDRRLLRHSLYALAGAVAGFVLLCAHNYAIAHELIQSSAIIKAFWGKTVGYQLRFGVEVAAIAAAPGSLLIEVGGHSIYAVAALHLLLAGVLLALLRWFPPASQTEPAARAPEGAPERMFLLALGVLATVGYSVVYAKSSVAIMTWYTANFVVPVALLYASALRPVRWRHAFPVLFASLLLLGVIGLRNADRAQLPTFDYELDAAEHLRNHPTEGHVGGWNVGILNYFEGGDVVNIDGLTNNDVVPYILSDKLHCYLLANDVRHVFDWQAMVACKGDHCPNYPALGGYTSGVFQKSLKPEYVVPGTETLKNSLVMYSVDMDTLAAAGDCGGGQAAATLP